MEAEQYTSEPTSRPLHDTVVENSPYQPGTPTDAICGTLRARLAGQTLNSYARLIWVSTPSRKSRELSIARLQCRTPSILLITLRRGCNRNGSSLMEKDNGKGGQIQPSLGVGAIAGQDRINRCSMAADI